MMLRPLPVIISVSALLSWAGALRIDCIPDSPVDDPAGLCQQRGCIFEPVESKDQPWCYFPENYGYSMDGEPEVSDSGVTVNLVRNDGLKPLFGNEFDRIVVRAEFQTDERLRVKIFPEGVDRYEVPVEVGSPDDTAASAPLYDFSVRQTDDRFYFEVVRVSSGRAIFSTDLAGLLLSSQFLQLPIRLPSENVYGIGETHQVNYKHSFDFAEYYLYSRDEPPRDNINLYGVQPQYTVLESDGNAHTVLILNSNAQEFNLIPGPAMVYRTIGGILDLYFFLGPTPNEANQQYSTALGRAPIPPYWSLGFQLCRYGYNTLDNMKNILQRTRDTGVPVDVLYGDIDIQTRNLGFTIDPERFGGLPEFVDELKKEGMRFMTILNPFFGIEEPAGTYKPFDLGQEMGVWVRSSDNISYQTGDVWPAKEDGSPMLARFADFSYPKTQEWWSLLLKELHDKLPFGALWIDMNEPINFNYTANLVCDDNEINFPPYSTGANYGNGLPDRSLCPDSQQYLGLHYDVHSLFGWMMSPVTLEAVQKATEDRGWVLSRSTYPGSGKWVSHWLGDNFSEWPYLKASIVGLLEFNRFGIPMVGADICGFIFDTNYELCARWYLLGAFYTFSRAHNGLDWADQDPGAFDENFGNIVRDVYFARYRFLPYYYTLFYQHYTSGSSVARALWDEFPTDETTWALDTQFLIGSGLMVSPVLDDQAKTKNIYFPDARWYSITYLIKQDNIYEENARQTWLEVDAPLEIIPLHLRGGIVYPLQKEANNTEFSRQNDWTLIVALDDNDEAKGELFIDDGVSLDTVGNEQFFLAEFELSEKTLSTAIVADNYDVSGQNIEKFEIVGVSEETITSVSINDEEVEFTFNHGRLTVEAQLPLDQPLTLTYE